MLWLSLVAAAEGLMPMPEQVAGVLVLLVGLFIQFTI
jgi:hypothetical protein